MLKKDIQWAIEGVTYLVKNVPYEELDSEGKEYLDVKTCILLGGLRDLMVMNEIPHILKFDDFVDIEF
jgi:hypothetical protein